MTVFMFYTGVIIAAMAGAAALADIANYFIW